jgi:hypothetical protein
LSSSPTASLIGRSPRECVFTKASTMSLCLWGSTSCSKLCTRGLNWRIWETSRAANKDSMSAEDSASDSSWVTPTPSPASEHERGNSSRKQDETIISRGHQRLARRLGEAYQESVFVQEVLRSQFIYPAIIKDWRRCICTLILTTIAWLQIVLKILSDVARWCCTKAKIEAARRFLIEEIQIHYHLAVNLQI